MTVYSHSTKLNSLLLSFILAPLRYKYQPHLPVG
jgi:hypothetical protein